MPDNVTNADCERRHRMLSWWNTTVLSFMGLLIVIVGWSGCASQVAQSEAIKAQTAVSETQKSVEVNAASAQERHGAITDKLDDIQAGMLRTEDRLNEFYRRNGGGK